MRLLIFGGTGKTGRELIKQALEAGHLVTVLVRNPKKVRISDPKLHVIQGDVLKPDNLRQCFVAQDAVLSALGHKRFFIKTRILSEGTRNIIAGMEASRVERLICITSLGINDSRFRLGLYYTLFVIPFILLFYFRDKSRQEEIIRQSHLKWTIVRPGQLINGRKQEHYTHGEKVGSYLLTKIISRSDVAHFMLNQLNSTEYVHKAPGIVY